MRKPTADRERLKHIADACAFVLKHTAGITFEQMEDDEVLSFALVKNLEIIGEAANYLSDEIKERMAQVEWPKIIKARHIFVHAYHETDWQIVWQIIEQKIPGLAVEIEKELKRLSSEEQNDNNATN